MFDLLSQKLQDIIGKASKNDVLTEDNIQDAIREIRRALLSSDVSLVVVKSFIAKIKDEVEGKKVIENVKPGELLVKIVHDELVNLLGSKNAAIDLTSNPSIVMMLGLQGSGKTTTCAKLALKLKEENKKPLLVGCDIYRPAAVNQLKILSDSVGADFFSYDTKDVLEIVRKSIEYAKENKNDVIILDTAGRLQIDTQMMAELLMIDRSFKLNEKLLVVDSMTGQSAVDIAENFNEQLDITGVILTKLDGDTRGGAALSVSYSTKKPIKFVGMGEKIEPLEIFYPDRMAGRILGMGDVVGLVERAQKAFDEKNAKELEEAMLKNGFSFDDFIKIQKQMKMLGSIENILGMLPIKGLKKEDRQKISNEGEKQFKKMEVIISSMTKKERQNPDLLNSSRKKRIAKGSGVPLDEVNKFVSQFEMTRKVMKNFNSVKNSLKNDGAKNALMKQALAMKNKKTKYRFK